MYKLLIAALLTGVIAVAQAADLDTVIVSQSGATLRVADVDAALQRLPREQWAGVMQDSKQINQLIISLLRDKQLAAEAVAEKLDQDEKVKSQIALATTEILSRARVSAFEQTLKVPDMSAAAKEEYAAHKAKYAVTAVVEVQHILIGEKGRSDGEAKALAEKVRAEAVASPGEFDHLVGQYSDDPSKATNVGYIRNATSDKVVPEFAQAAAKLKSEGEISPLVRTKYGYHIMRLIKAQPAHQRTFDEVRNQIETGLRENYVADQRKAFLAKFDEGAPTVNPQLMDILHERYVPATPAAAGAKTP